MAFSSFRGADTSAQSTAAFWGLAGDGPFLICTSMSRPLSPQCPGCVSLGNQLCLEWFPRKTGLCLGSWVISVFYPFKRNLPLKRQPRVIIKTQALIKFPDFESRPCLSLAGGFQTSQPLCASVSSSV